MGLGLGLGFGLGFRFANQREQLVAVELRRGPRELRCEVLHQVLDEVALAQQQVALDVRAVLA